MSEFEKPVFGQIHNAVDPMLPTAVQLAETRFRSENKAKGGYPETRESHEAQKAKLAADGVALTDSYFDAAAYAPVAKAIYAWLHQKEDHRRNAILSSVKSELFDHEGRFIAGDQFKTPQSLFAHYGLTGTPTARCKTHVETICADGFAKLRELQAEFDKLNKDQECYAPAKATEVYHSQGFDHSKEVSDGGDPHAELEFRTEETIHAEYRTRRSAIERRLMEITREAVRAALPIRECAFFMLFFFADLLEKEERETAAKFSLPFLPSSFLKVHWTAFVLGWSRSKTFATIISPTSPKTLVREIVEL